MSLDTTIRGNNGVVVDADTTTSALQTIVKGVATVDFSHADFTLDSFERVRTSNPTIAFENSFSAQTPALATTIWESTAYGAGTETLTTNLFGTDLNTTTATATGRWIQAINHVRYAPGISTLMRFTFNANSLVSNVRSRIGMFTDQGTFPSTAGDGLYFEIDGSTKNFVRRYMTQGAGGTEERVAQASWNMDKLDGTGASGITLDFTKTQHLVMEFQHLGVGTIRFGFETGPAGIVWAHEMHTVNSASEAWARTGTLPVRAECYTFGTATQAGKLTLINCVVIQEGDTAALRGWRYFGGDSGATGKVGGTAIGLYPLLSLRAASTNDLTKRARIIPNSISISVVVAGTVGLTPIKVSLLMLPTPNTGATFAVTQGGSNTTVDQAATAATAVTGAAIWTGVIPNVVGTHVFDLSAMKDNANVIGYNAAGTVAITGQSVLTLAAGPQVAAFTAAATLCASISWKELV